MSDHFPWLRQHPLASSSLIIAACVLPLLALAKLVPPTFDYLDLAKTVARLALSALLIGLLYKLGWQDRAGITTIRWRPAWILAMLPMFVIALINLTGVDWQNLVFTPRATLSWLGYNMSVGLFEEVLLRAVCFTLLAIAWQAKPNGLMKAAVAQALIFGLIHLVNLVHAPLLDTLAQTVYATLIGLGFAGLIAITGSIWPGVVLHTVINLAGSVNDLANAPADDGGSLAGYLVAIAVITLVAAIPGTLQVRRAMQQAIA